MSVCLPSAISNVERALGLLGSSDKMRVTIAIRVILVTTVILVIIVIIVVNNSNDCNSSSNGNNSHTNCQ